MANQDLRFRRRVTTVGEQQPKRNLPVIIAVAASGLIIVPALVYTALHPAAVSSTVKQFTSHVAMPVKDIGRIAIVASRTTPTPQPSASPSPSPTPAAKTKPTPAQLAHQAHLKHAHDLQVAMLHPRKVASSGETSDISAGTYSADQGSSAGTDATPANATVDTTASTTTSGTTTSAGAATAAPATTGSTTNGAAAAPENTTATVAAADQQPQADATPVYAPEVVVDARFIHQAQPDYPEVAKVQNAQGTAVVFATVGPNGKVISTRIDQSTGNKLLDQAALTAAHQSSFQPPQINGKPATETYRLVYTFTL